MTVDKFGHYFNRKTYKDEKNKTFFKMFGFSVYGDNINIENKRISNVAPPLERLDAVNKDYVNSQIKEISVYVISQIDLVKKEIKDLNKAIYHMVHYSTD